MKIDETKIRIIRTLRLSDMEPLSHHAQDILAMEGFNNKEGFNTRELELLINRATKWKMTNDGLKALKELDNLLLEMRHHSIEVIFNN